MSWLSQTPRDWHSIRRCVGLGNPDTPHNVFASLDNRNMTSILSPSENVRDGDLITPMFSSLTRYIQTTPSRKKTSENMTLAKPLVCQCKWLCPLNVSPFWRSNLVKSRETILPNCWEITMSPKSTVRDDPYGFCAPFDCHYRVDCILHRRYNKTSSHKSSSILHDERRCMHFNHCVCFLIRISHPQTLEKLLANPVPSSIQLIARIGPWRSDSSVL